MAKMKKSPHGTLTAEDEAAPPSLPVDESEPSTTATEGPPTAPPSEEEESSIFDLFGLPSNAKDEQIQEIVNRRIAADVEESGLDDTYTVLVLRDSISRSSSNRIYQSIREAPRTAPVLLIVDSDGGEIAAAYLIAKLCRQHTDRSFEVAVARRAKSAATLICCGADRIHMGSLSELGPIDPQIGAIPALAMKHSVEHIAELASQYPSAASMFSDYLAKALPIQSLGFFERAAESAVQYATRLLAARKIDSSGDHDAIARRLVYLYKDHGFVIDSAEAQAIFGTNVVSIDSDAYKLSNRIFETLDLARFACETRLARILSYVGDINRGCWVWAKDS